MKIVVKVLAYGSMSVFILGMTISTLIGIEMILIFQFTYCGLVMLKKL